MNGKRDIFLKVSRHVNRKSNNKRASKHTVDASPPPSGTEARRNPGTEVEREGGKEQEGERERDEGERERERKRERERESETFQTC